MSWKAKADAKRQSVSNLIPKEWRIEVPIPSKEAQRHVTGDYIRQFLSEVETEITESDAVDIVNNTTSGRWTAEAVTRAFCHRAAIAHQIIPCLHEIFFEQAIEDAKAADQQYSSGKSVGPLHGLPVSLKDTFHVKGVGTTLGFVHYIDTFEGQSGTGREKVFESELVKELRALGAILFCKTSVPHTLLALETMNQLIGYTWNPKNRYLSAGGSSGGEGALLSFRGSPIGFGTDSGGSIRAPSSFNGLYGIRTSPSRLPYKGMATWLAGNGTVSSVIGPMASSARSIVMMIKAILSQQPWLHDPRVLELPWRQDKEEAALLYTKPQSAGGQKLSLGLLRNDGVVQPHPPVQRALDIVEHLLSEEGHEILDWKPPSHYTAIQIIQNAWQYDGGKAVFKAFATSGEPISDQLALLYGKEGPKEEWNATKIAKNIVAKEKYQEGYLEYWNSTRSNTSTGRPIDVIIAPASESAATRPGGVTYGGYTTAFSALDYTVVTVPVTTAQKAVDVADKTFQPLNDFDKKVQDGYDAELYDGAYIGIQLVGRMFEEEKILVLAEYLGRLIAADATRGK